MAPDSIITDAQIFSSILGPERSDLEPGVAESILRLRFADAQNDRMRALADKNNQGLLTEAERSEMESYRRVGNFISIMQAKARLSLEKSADGR